MLRLPRSRVKLAALASARRGMAGTTAPGGVDASATVEPPPAGGHLPSVATSRLMRSTRDSALRTPGLQWNDEEKTHHGPSPVAGQRQTQKMNLYQAIVPTLIIVRLNTRTRQNTDEAHSQPSFLAFEAQTEVSVLS